MEAASGHMAQSRASSDNAETSNSFFFSTFRSKRACGVWGGDPMQDCQGVETCSCKSRFVTLRILTRKKKAETATSMRLHTIPYRGLSIHSK